MCMGRARINLLLCVALMLFVSQRAPAQFMANKDLTDTASVPTLPELPFTPPTYRTTLRKKPPL